MTDLRVNISSRGLIAFLVSVISLSLMIGNVFASSIDTIQLLKISAQDERAIIKTPDGKMQIIKPGDIVGSDGKVVEITAGRVVFEEKTGNEKETVIIRLEDGKQRMERVKKIGERQPQLYGVKAPHEKAQSKAPVKDKRKKDKKQKPVKEINKSSVVN